MTRERDKEPLSENQTLAPEQRTPSPEPGGLAPETVAPPPDLEDRIVTALHAEGLLGPAAAGNLPAGRRTRWRNRVHTGARRGVAARRAAWWPLAAAAALAVFAAGFAAGQFTGARSTADALLAVREADAAATAALVQQAGTAYVRAIGALADQSELSGRDPAAAQGEAAAVAAFTAAAEEWTRLDPENETAHQVLSLLTSRQGGAEGAAASQTIWF